MRDDADTPEDGRRQVPWVNRVVFNLLVVLGLVLLAANEGFRRFWPWVVSSWF